MKKLPLAIAVSAAILSSTAVHAENGVGDNWTVNGYGHLLYNVGESLDTNSTWAHRRDYHAAGSAFSANPNQVEFTITKADKYEGGAYANYVLKTEYGNNEGSNGQPYYTSSGGNEGHMETGQLEFKEAYIELGDLSFFPQGASIWVGKRYLNREAGIITKEYWKQSSGVGTGVKYNKMGLSIVSADPGDGSCTDGKGVTSNCKPGQDNADGTHTTMSSVDANYYGLEGLGGSFDFDAKYMFRKNVDGDKTADTGFGLSAAFNTSFYGLDGWSKTAVTFGQGIGATKGVNFGSWNGGWQNEDQSIFVTTYGVLNLSENWQLGHEFVLWDLSNSDDKDIWGSPDGVTRIFYALNPSYKVNENFRLEGTFTYAAEMLGSDATGKAAWGREDEVTTFYTATLATVFTVNNDYFGRPQIKPYVTYMASSDDGVTWSTGSSSSNETRVGVEGEIWF